MVTTLPKVHIALAGLDKLIPDFETALTALTVLPRNATSQRITSALLTVPANVKSAKTIKKNCTLSS